MTDKRKDEMLEIRLIERHGNVEYSYRTKEFITKNEHWIVNGKRFDRAPTGREVEAAYASPPVPDDVAKAFEIVKQAIEDRHTFDNSHTDNLNCSIRTHSELYDEEEKIYQRHLAALEVIRAASTPSPEAQAVSEVTVELREILEFIASGCLVAPDGGEPCLADAMIEAKRGLKIIKGIKIKAGGG